MIQPPEPSNSIALENLPDVVVFRCRPSRWARIYRSLLGSFFVLYLLSLNLRPGWLLLTLIALAVLIAADGWRCRRVCSELLYRDGGWWLRPLTSWQKGEGRLYLKRVELLRWQCMPWLVAIRFIGTERQHYDVRLWRDTLDEQHWKLLPSLLSL